MSPENQWLKNYLLEIAESYGANSFAAPRHEKGKRVRVSEFLTLDSENKNATVWAHVHDEELGIPIKFSKESVALCAQSGRRLTATRNPLLTIKAFKPFCARIPLGRDGGMSIESRVALECGFVSVADSLGGAPSAFQPIESIEPLRAWQRGLREDGGAGNILKERKKTNERTTNLGLIKRPPNAEPGALDLSKKRGDSMKNYNEIWREANIVSWMRPQVKSADMFSVAAEDARALGSSPSPSQQYSVPSSPISNWSLSDHERASPFPDAPAHFVPSSSLSKDASYLSAPTPAQRPVTDHTLILRRVARPPSPLPVGLGPSEVLVPDSDASQSQSQSQSQLPSQSRSYPESQPCSQNQPQPKSQLPASPQFPIAAGLVEVEMIDADDARTQESLFGHLSEEKLRKQDDDPGINMARSSTSTFLVSFDALTKTAATIGWEQLYTVYARI
ncbi:unnamed protein product [Mycena citricolor]|uniref:Telomere replication protein EST3 n=1 Tax=Mycena citricolor TaxID=2018698 RepID=A0AAD2HSC6_9AGAR|nr:unnamed protein product [Mycena citricolor]